MIIDGLHKILQFKVVLHGPGMSGKTTFIKSILRRFGKEVLSTESSIKRTLNCDYGVISIPFNNWELKVHLYTTAGAKYYQVTRPVILSGCDGLIFIADSQESELINNVFSWKELSHYFKSELKRIPKIIAFNKQDLSNKFEEERFLEQVKNDNLLNHEILNTIAINETGTVEAFESLMDLIIKSFNILDFISQIWDIY